MRKKLLLTTMLSAIMLSNSIASATMFTIKFSTNDIKINNNTTVDMESQFDYYPIKYTIDGSDPASGTVFNSSEALSFENGAYKLKAGVFTDDGEAISDTYTRYYVKGVRSKAIQTDTSRITYTEYDEPNSRYPYHMFDGDATRAQINKSWTIKYIPVTVSYDEIITANMCVVTARVRNEAVSWFQNNKNSDGTSATKKEKTTADMSITLDIKQKTDSGEYESVLGGGSEIILPTGTEVIYQYADNRADVWVTFAFDLNELETDEIIFDFQNCKNLSLIKEIELFEANEQKDSEDPDNPPSGGETPDEPPEDEKAEVIYSTTNPRTANLASSEPVTLSTDVEGGTIIYTLDGTSPAIDNGTEYTEGITIPEGTIRLTSAVFKDGVKVSEDFCHTYVNNPGTHLGVQTNTSKISTDRGTNPKFAFDGDSQYGYPINAFTVSRTNLPNPIGVTVNYDNAITFDTVTPLVAVNESAYVTNVSAGSTGTNSNGTRGDNTEYLTKEMTLQFKVDYVKEGETEVTEGEWQTVTMPVGYPCKWSWNGSYGRIYLYTPAIAIDEVTAKSVTISVKDYAEDASTAKIWNVKEYELYNSKKATPVEMVPEVVYSTTNPRTANLASTSPVTLSTNVDDGTIIYTLDGTSPAIDNGTEYTEGVVIPQGTVRLTSAVFKDGVKVSEDFCHTYVNNPGTHLGVQTNTSKISTDRGTNPKFAFDGDSQYGYPTNAFTVSRTNLPNPISATVNYDNAITFDTVTPLVTVNESAYVTNVSAGSSGTNSTGTRGDNTEYLTKEMTLQFKVDYVKEGETEVTEGEWQTVTMPVGYPCKWSWNGSYGRIYLYTPAIAIDEVTAKSVTISVKDYAESATVAKIWNVKEYELYKSNGVSYDVVYSIPSGVVSPETGVTLSSTGKDTVVRYTTDGTAPTASSAVYSTPITIGMNCTMKINAAVFDAEGNMCSDVFSNVYVAGKYTNRAIQTDTGKISYETYTEPNNRLPKYAFDGNDKFEEAHLVWTLKALDITVSYDSPVKADAMLISARMDKKIIDEENLVTTEDSYITVDVKNGDTSVTGGEKVLLLPAGSKVNKATQTDGTNTTTSYWAWLGTGNISNFAGDSITYCITDFYGVGGIKEIELIKTGKVVVNAVVDDGAAVISGSNTFDEACNVTVIKAGYITVDDVEALCGVKTMVWSITAGANDEEFDVSQFDDISDAETVKYFVWDIETLIPFCDDIEVREN